MKWSRFALFVLLSVHISQSVNAQDTWEHIDGLPCEEVYDVMLGDNGYIWIGTRLGLIRYDGYSISNYRNDLAHPFAFSSCNIRCLASSPDSCLYAGAFFGLNTIDLRSQSISATHFERNDYVNAVVFDSSNRLWIGTGNGLYLKKNGALAPYSQIPNGMIMHLCEAPSGKVVVAIANRGVFVIDNNGRSAIVKGTEYISPNAALVDDDGTLWIGTRHKGLYCVEGGSVLCKAEYDSYVVNDLLYEPESRQLILATDNGIVGCSTKPLTLGLQGIGINRLCRDNSGNIWAATETHGVYRMRYIRQPFHTTSSTFAQQTVPIASQFDVRSLADTLLWATIPQISAVYQTANGTTFVGTQSQGFYMIEQGTIRRHINKENSTWLKNNSVLSFCTLNDDNTFIATWIGLYLMASTGNGHLVEKIGTSDVSTMHTLTIYKETDNSVWLGLVGGIAHVTGNLNDLPTAQITVYTHINQKGIDAPENVGLLTDRHDKTAEYQLGGIYRIVKDGYGRIWACTSEPGLLLYDAEKDLFRSVSQQMGILGDNVHSMEVDRYGNYWMTTNYGILQMAVDSLGKPSRMQLYSHYDGLPTSYFGSTTSTMLADGSLCFLNQQHLMTTTPKQEFGETGNNRTWISNITVNGNSIIDSDVEYDAAPPYTHHIVLSHEQNNLVFCLTTLSFGQEHSISYRYRLEGVDREYMMTDIGSNTIRYSPLPPGNYILRYGIAKDHNGADDNEQVLFIEILQPLWWRWWAKLLYAILLLSLGSVFLYNIKEKKRRQHQLEILKIEKQKQEELYQNKMSFYTRVLHEFMTPLALMSELTHTLHEKVRPSLQATLYMLTIQVDKLKENMGNIVDVKEDASAQEALKKAHEMTKVDRDFLQRCTESANNHIADTEYTHHVMMAEVGASHATLYRKLKVLTGMDATTFIRSIRMRTACQILSQSPNIRISELAERVGYNDPRYFSSCFKKEFGMSPREYLAKNG